MSVPDGLGPLALKVLESMEVAERLMGRAREPGAGVEIWHELGSLIDVDTYQRIAANRDARRFDEDVRLLHRTARIAEIEIVVRRIAEADGTVFVDALETVITGSDRFTVNTLGVVEFDAAGKIRRKTTYQQWDRPPTHVAKEAG
jgi:hypothetical protein